MLLLTWQKKFHFTLECEREEILMRYRFLHKSHVLEELLQKDLNYEMESVWLNGKNQQHRGQFFSLV